jgi:hypothetical protein
VAVVAAVAGLLWMLSDDGPATPSSAQGAVTPVPGSPTGASDLPPARTPEAASPLQPEPLTPEAPTDEPAPLPPEADLATSLVEAALTGRVVDKTGTPVADALVLFHPTMRARRALGLPRHYVFEPVPWDAFPQIHTDAEGRFALTGRDELPDPSEEYGQSVILLVEAAGYELTLVPCPPWKAGGADVGDIRLEDGVAYLGRVVDPVGAPIAGAHVRIPRSTGAPGDKHPVDWDLARERLDAFSGPDGTFRMEGSWPGSCFLHVTAPGFRVLGREVHAPALGEFDTGLWPLEPAQIIEGQVVDPAGAPLSGVEILARPRSLAWDHDGLDAALRDLRMRVMSRNQEEFRVDTDADGAFRFDALSLEPHDIVAGRDDLDPVAVRGARGDDSPLHIVMQPMGTLLVRVVSALDGEPIEGATGSARRRSTSDAASSNAHDMDPSLAVLEGIEAALHAGLPSDTPGLLLVRQAGWQRTDVTARAPGHAARTVELPGIEAPARVEHEVRLEPAATLAGRVVDENRAPVGDASVKLERDVDRPGSADTKKTETTADGSYELDALSPGAWRLSARAEGMAPCEPVTLTIDDARAVEAPDLVLQRGARIDGILLAVDGTPGAGGRVTANETSAGGRSLSLNTESSGEFHFGGLEAGTWNLLSYPGAEAVVDLAVGGSAQVTLQLQQLAVIRGRVTDTGGPVEGARIVPAEDAWWGEGLAVTDALGEYRAEVRAGTTTLRARYPGDDDLLSPAGEVEATWGGDHLLDLAFGSAVLAGHVVDDTTDEPLANVSVTASSPRTEHDLFGTSRTVRTDAEGGFHFSRLHASEWTVRNRAGTHQMIELDPIALGPGEIHDDLELRVPPAVRLVGRVLMPDGRPPRERLQVQVTSPDRPGWVTSSGIQDDGAFLVSGLAEGSYHLEVRYPNQVPPRRNQEHVFASADVVLILGQELPLQELLAIPPE